MKLFRRSRSLCLDKRSVAGLLLLATSLGLTQPTLASPYAEPKAVEASPQALAAELKQEAVRAAVSIAEAYPTDPLAFALLGSAYYNTGNSDEATVNLRKCLTLNPNLSDAYEVLARVAYDRGELEESVRLFQEALKRGPSSVNALSRLGRAQMDLGRTEESIETLRKATQLPQATSESFYLLGQAYLQIRDYARAKESFQKATLISADHTQAYFGLYTACNRLGQSEESARYREQFLRLEARDRKDLTDRNAESEALTGLPFVRQTVAQTLFGAGQIYKSHEQPAMASKFLRRAAVLDEESMTYRSALEAFYIQRKALAEGVTVFEQLVSEQPKNRYNHMFLGRLHNRLDHFEAAERCFQKVQELAPDWAEGYRALTELYLRTNRRLPESRVMAQRAVDLEPKASHYYFLAVACVKNQDRSAAAEALKKAVSLNPGELKYQQFLQQLQKTP
jgi:tetratricopeptide (TPR) repeat protein